MEFNELPTTAPQPSLLGIPSELRVNIFEYLFPGLAVFTTSGGHFVIDETVEEARLSCEDYKYPIDILTVCKKLSEEASAVLGSSLTLETDDCNDLRHSIPIARYSPYIRYWRVEISDLRDTIDLNKFPRLEILDLIYPWAWSCWNPDEQKWSSVPIQEVLDGSFDEIFKQEWEADMLALSHVKNFLDRSTHSFKVLFTRQDLLYAGTCIEEDVQAHVRMVSDIPSELLHPVLRCLGCDIRPRYSTNNPKIHIREI